MKSEVKHISIPEPCSESWDAMEGSEKGKFCQCCDKEVYDLRKSTTAEIHAAYVRASGKLCGVVSSNQITPQRQLGPRLLRRFALAVMMIFGSTLFVIANETAGFLTALKANAKSVATQNDSLQTVTIHGMVKDSETGEPIFGAHVRIGSTSIGASTDVDGNFSIEVKREDVESFEALTVSASYLGYSEEAHTIVDVGNGNVTVNFSLSQSRMGALSFDGAVVGAIQSLDITSLLFSLPFQEIDPPADDARTSTVFLDDDEN
jgi:hypothetical protein